MTSLYRDLNTAALEANLNKTQLAVFLALSTQTLGYGKTDDPLTDNRIANMTGIRVDRVRPAIRAIIKKGLFDRCEHHRYEYEYSIGEKFLEAHQGKVYTPFIPKKRSDTEKENPISGNGANQPEKEEHTVIQPTKSNLQQQTNTKTKKTKFNPQQQTKTETETKKITKSHSPQQTQSVKILFTDTEQGQHPPSFAIETSMANTRVEVSFNNPKAATQPSVNTDTEALTTLDTIAALKKLLAMQNTDKPTTDNNQTATTEPEPTPAEPVITTPTPEPEVITTPTPEPEPTVVCGDVEEEIVIVEKQPAQSPLSLPKAIIAEDVYACNQPFKMLSRELQEKVLLVFNYNMKTRTIKSTTGYFITLAKSALEGGLTVPREALVDTPKHQKAQAKIKAKQDEQLHRIELWSEYTWLQDQAKHEKEDVAMDVLAKRFGEKTEAAYAMYGHLQ